MPARLSPTRHFQWTMLIESPNPTGERHISEGTTNAPLHTTYTHFKTPTDELQLTPPKVLSQERSHIPLAWLARNIAWLVDHKMFGPC